jgi:hypothetical protein
MDFIMRLIPSKNFYNIATAFVDKLWKIVHFAPNPREATAEKVKFMSSLTSFISIAFLSVTDTNACKKLWCKFRKTKRGKQKVKAAHKVFVFLLITQFLVASFPIRKEAKLDEVAEKSPQQQLKVT